MTFPQPKRWAARRRRVLAEKATARREWRTSDDRRAIAYLTELRSGKGCPTDSPHAPMCLMPPTFLNMQTVFCADCGKRLTEFERVR
jgi:hypothetical protein